MKPHLFSRRSFIGFNLLCCGCAAMCGCSGPWSFRGQSPDVEEILVEEDEHRVRYIGEIAGSWGLNYMKVENVALVTGLEGTGGDPPPSSLRDRLINEMKTHQVADPEKVLASSNRAMVTVLGYLPPGIQKGDRFDVLVRVPTRGQTTSLRGGFLMQTRLQPMEMLGGGIKTGHVFGLARGPVIVESVFDDTDDKVLHTRGRVLGGGVALRSRPLGLQVRNDMHSVMTTAMIGKAINNRFYTTDNDGKRGAATPKDDKRIELAVPTQYKHNISRYFQVIRNMALRESPADRLQRLKDLERQLLEPTTSSVAALRLEAIGEDATKVLHRGLQSKDAEVRFFAGEALAYMGEPAAVEHLADTARNIPAFRWHAMTALASMDDVEAGVALRDLLHGTSAETRYGAFRALRARSADDPLVRGEVLGEHTAFSYHVIGTSGEPMIHFARARRPEIVVFGHEQRIGPAFLYIGKGLTIKGRDDNTVVVSTYTATGEDRHEICSSNVDEVIRMIVKMGGSFAEVLEILKKAKATNSLDSRIVINAVPKPGRAYRRESEDASAANVESTSGMVFPPLPDLFRNAPGGESDDSTTSRDSDAEEIGWEEEGEPKKGFFGRMTGWFSE